MASVVSTHADVGGIPKSVQGVDADVVDEDARRPLVSDFQKIHPRKPHEHLA